MASTSGAIRAGRAFIELFTDDTKMQRGLNLAAKKISAFGNGITSLGKRFALLGAAAAAPLGLAVKKFADAGSGLVDMSDRIGITVEQLSTLRYAAEQSGATLEDLETGVKFMQKALAAAAGGNKTAIASFDALGLSVDELAKLTPDEQFRRIATAISGLGDDTAITAMSMKLLGKSGTTLIPLMKGGAKGIEELQQAARDAGLEMSLDMAVAAEKLGDEMQTLNDQISRATINVGSALAPAMSKILGIITPMIEAFSKWASRNQETVIAVAAVAAGAASLGVALVALGSVVTATGAIVGGLATAIGLIANPIGAAVIAFGGFQIAVAALNGDLEGAAAIAKDAFDTIAGDATTAVSGIVAALKSGDIETAMKIVSTTVQLEWERMLDTMKASLDVFAEEVRLFGIVSFKAPERVKSPRITELEGQLAALSQGARQTAAAGSTAASLGGAADWVSSFTGVNVRGFMPGGQANAPSGLNALAASMSSAVMDGLSTAGEFLTSNRTGKGRNAPLGLSGLLSSGLSTASDFMNQIGGGVLTAEKTLSTAGTFNGLLAGQQLSGQKAAAETAENTKNAAKTLVEIRRKINGKPKATA